MLVFDSAGSAEGRKGSTAVISVRPWLHVSLCHPEQVFLIVLHWCNIEKYKRSPEAVQPMTYGLLAIVNNLGLYDAFPNSGIMWKGSVSYAK